MYAFVLKRANFRENDQIITLYTNEKGKIEVLARGVKKILSKNAAFLEPYFLLEAELIPGKEITHLVKAVPVECYKNILADLDKLLILKTVYTWLGSLLHTGERDIKIFVLIKKFLEYLNGDKTIEKNIVYVFLAKLLNLLGFAPQLEGCVVCDNVSTAGFYPAGGGVICKKCLVEKKQADEKVYPLRQNDWQFLKLLFAGSWSKLGVGNEVADRLVFLYAQYHSERKLAKLKVF